MGLSLAARFVVYAPAGARLGEAPFPAGFRVSDVFNDIGAGSLDYLASAPRAELLEDLCEVAVEVNDGRGDGQNWVEATARMMRLKRGGSVIDAGRTRSYTLHSYGLMLSKMRMLREEELNADSERILADKTVGGVIKTLFDEAKNRGNAFGFDYDFTATVDSNGAPWGGNIPAVTLRYGDDLLSLLRTLADNGACDWRVVGRTLQMYKPDTLGTDRSSTIRLVNGIDFVEAPDDEDATELAGRIGVIGDEGRTYEAISPFSGSWGLWEEVVNASGVKDIGGLQFIGEAEQRRRSAPRVQMTRRLSVTDVPHLPFIAYRVGDTVKAPNDRGADAPLRVRELQLSLDASGFSVNATLNDRILERDIRDRRMWTGMLGGASGSSGGSGVPTKPDDRRRPKAPTGFVVSSAHLYDAVGAPFAVIDARFVPVTEGEDGKPIEIQRHELWGRRNLQGEPWRKITDADRGESRVTYSPLPAGENWEFRVGAISQAGIAGPYSTSALLNLAEDTTPPNKPSKPSGESRLGQMIIKWDGLDEFGAHQPTDFRHALVWMADSATGAGVMVGTMFDNGDTFVPEMQPYNARRWFWLTAVDTSGNMSESSERIELVAKPLVDTDMIGRVIDEANIKLDSITQDLLAQPIKDTLASADGKNRNFFDSAESGPPAPPGGFRSGDMWFNPAKGYQLKRWNGTAWVLSTLGADALTAGSIGSAQLAAAVNNAITAAQTTADGKSKVTRSTSVASGAGKAGDQWWRYSGSQIIGLWIHDGSSWVPQTLTDAVITNLNAGSITAGTLSADRIGASSITGEKIAADSITAAKMVAGTITAASGIIANAAIGDAQISGLNAGKIVAGYLDAARIDARTIAATKLVVGDFTNLAFDVQSAPEREAYPAQTNWRYAKNATVSPGNAGAPWMIIQDTGAGPYSAMRVGEDFAVKPGDQIFISYRANRRGSDSAITLNLQVFGEDGLVVAQDVYGARAPVTAPYNSWQTYSGVATIPSGASFARPMFKRNSSSAEGSGDWVLFEPIIRRMTTGELLVDGAVTARTIAANAVTAGSIAALQVEAGHIKSNAVTADKINAGAVTAVKIAANAVTADKIQAKSITAEKLVIGDFTNVASGSDFEDDATNPWDISPPAFSISTRAARVHSGTRCLYIDGSKTGTAYLRTSVATTEGEEWYAELWASRSATWDGTASNSKLRIGANTGALLGAIAYTATGLVSNGAPVKLSTSFTVPAGVTSLNFSIRSDATQGGVWIDDIVIRRKASAELIVNGAIRAEHVASNAITSAKIAAGAVTANEIASNAVTSAKIAAGAVTANELSATAITGKTITGGTINGSVINGGVVSAEDGLNVTGGILFSNANGPVARLRPSGLGVQTSRLDVTDRFVAGSYYFSTLAANLPITSINMLSTTSSANVYSSSNSSNLARVSSMRQLKLDREEIGPDYRILDLVPHTWRDRAMVEENPDTERRIAGFVAEDLATLTAFHDNAFDPLLEVDEDGRAIGIAYDRIPAYLFPLIKDMQSRLAAAEERIELLEAA